MSSDGTLCQDSGADYYTRLKPERTKDCAVNQLRHLGNHVELTEAEP